jgi:hypothetical protein
MDFFSKCYYIYTDKSLYTINQSKLPIYQDECNRVPGLTMKRIIYLAAGMLLIIFSACNFAAGFLDEISLDQLKVDGDTVTSNTRPTWSWSEQNNKARYRYSFDEITWDETRDLSFTPEVDLEIGYHTLYVQQTLINNVWSRSGSHETLITNYSISAPDVWVQGGDHTSNTMPTFEWNNQLNAYKYEYQLDDSDWVTVPATTTTYTPGSPLSEGTHTFSVRVMNIENITSHATSTVVHIDMTQPTVAINTITPMPTSENRIEIEIIFSEPITYFDYGSITIASGHVTDLYYQDEARYTALIMPMAGSVTVTIDALVAYDYAGNGNIASDPALLTYTGTSINTIITGVSPATKDSPFTVNIEFSETVQGFDLTDCIVNGANATALNGGPQFFTLEITQTGENPITIEVPDAVCYDQATGTRPNNASPVFHTRYDSTPPTASMTSSASNPVYQNWVTVELTFSEDVTGFEQSDLDHCINTFITNFHQHDSQTYYFDLFFHDNGLGTVDINASTFTDPAGNDNNAVPQFSRTCHAFPELQNVLTEGAANTTTFPVPLSLHFNQQIDNISETIINNGLINATVVPGSITSIGTGDRWDCQITPHIPGNIQFQLNAGQILNTNGLYNKDISSIFNINYNYMPEGTFLTVGDGGNIATTNDPSAGWTVNTISSFNLKDVESIPGGHFMVVGLNGTVLWSDDAGNTFQDKQGTIPGANILNGIAHGNGVWVTVSSSGKIFHASDEPFFTWNEVDVSPGTEFMSIAFNEASSHFMIVTVNGQVWRTQDPMSVDNWINVSNGIGPQTLWDVVADPGDNSFVIVGSSDGTSGVIYRSGDQGATWDRYVANSRALNLYTVCMGPQYVIAGHDQIIVGSRPVTGFNDLGDPAADVTTPLFSGSVYGGNFYILTTFSSDIWFTMTPGALTNWEINSIELQAAGYSPF